MNSEIHFFAGNNYERYVKKFFTQKVASFSLATNVRTGSHYFAVYSVGVNAAPSNVQIYEYPDFKQARAGKSFFKADHITYKWRERGMHKKIICLGVFTNIDSLLTKGDAVLIISATDHSKKSYYGEQALHYLDINGKAFTPRLDKEGPISAVEWDKSSNETHFCVVYGHQPSKVVLFNCKPEPVHSFGEHIVNQLHYNPFGNLMVLCGFGNLRGCMMIFDVANRKQIAEINCSDATYVQWSPDGQYLLTAVCAPRMRVDNGYKVWHYSGRLLKDQVCEAGKLMYSIAWKSAKGVFQKPEITITEIAKPIAKAEPKKYVPPALRKPDYKPPKSVDPVAEKQKKIRALQKKLNEIEKIKTQHKNGQKLELKQIEKMERQQELAEQLEALQLAS